MFSNRIVEHPGRVKLTAVSGETDTYDVTRAEGEVTQEGTPLDADNLNKEIQDMINSSVAGFSTAVIRRGRTSIKTKAAKTAAKVKVTFSTAFSSVPYVVVTPNSTAPSTISLSVSEVTTTGFYLVMQTTKAKTVKVNWIAIL